MSAFFYIILCLPIKGGGGSRPEFNGPKISRYGDTEIRERSVGGGGGGHGGGRTNVVDTEIRVQDTEIPRYTIRQDV